MGNGRHSTDIFRSSWSKDETLCHDVSIRQVSLGSVLTNLHSHKEVQPKKQVISPLFDRIVIFALQSSEVKHLEWVTFSLNPLHTAFLWHNTAIHGKSYKQLPENVLNKDTCFPLFVHLLAYSLNIVYSSPLSETFYLLCYISEVNSTCYCTISIRWL